MSPAVSPRDEEAGDAAEARPGPRVDDEDVRHRRVGDEGLRAVQHPAVAVGTAVVARASALDPESGSVIAVAPMALPSASLGSHARFWASLPTRTRARARGRVGGDREHEAVVAGAVADPLEDRDGREQVLAPAAPLRGDEKALEPEVGAGLPRLAGEAPLAVALGRPVGQPRGGELLRAAAETQVVIGPLEVHAPPPRAIAAPHTDCGDGDAS